MITRIQCPALDAILGEQLPVLDKGFIRIVDYMGDDTSIVQAARISYGMGYTTPERDQRLIAYLMRHRHTSPFEMCEIKLHIKMPIFIARQWVRHRTANINEFSGRYSFMPDSAYIPTHGTMGGQSASNHQATNRGSLSEEETQKIIERIQQNTEMSYENYLWCLNSDAEKKTIHDEHAGLSRELSRMNLSLNHYTEWYWKCDLHNLLHFLHLRIEAGAQYEIQAYARCIAEKIVKPWVPWTYAAFEEYRLNSISLSANGQKVLHDLIEGNPIQPPEHYGLTKFEWREIWAALGRDMPETPEK